MNPMVRSGIAVTQSIWTTLGSRGVPRERIETALQKVLGPPTTIAKPQFREVFLREVTGAMGRPVTHEETIELFLLADEVWEAWPFSSPIASAASTGATPRTP